jgi:type I restriction enzyme S subunit
VELGEVCEIKSGGTPSKNCADYWDGNIAWYSSGELNSVYTVESVKKIKEEGLKNSNASLFPKGSLLIGMYDTAAFKMSLLDREAAFNQAICGVKPNEIINLYFLYLYFLSKKHDYLNDRIGVRQRNLSKGYIEKLLVPVPSVEIQNTIVDNIRFEYEIVIRNKELIKIFEAKIKSKIASVWGQ